MYTISDDGRAFSAKPNFSHQHNKKIDYIFVMSLTSLHQQNTDECVEFAYELNRLLDILAVDVYGFLSS